MVQVNTGWLVHTGLKIEMSPFDITNATVQPFLDEAINVSKVSQREGQLKPISIIYTTMR